MNRHDWSDRALVRHARTEGDTREVFEILYRRYSVRVWKRACGFVQCHDAWDVTDAVFLALWKKIPEFREPCLVRAFLHRTLYYRAVEFVRRRNRMEPCDPVALDLLESNGTSHSGNGDLSPEEILTLLEARLSPREFRVVRTLFFEGRGYTETARREGISQSGVRRCLHGARKKIKKIPDFPNISSR